MAQTTLTDPTGYLWNIQEQNWGEIHDGTSDAYDNWPQLCVTTDLGLTGNCTAAETFNAGASPARWSWVGARW